MFEALRKTRQWFLHHYSLFRQHQKDAPSHKQVDNTKFLMMKRKPSLCAFLFSLFSPFLSFPTDPHIRLWAARTDRLHKQIRELPGRHLLTDQLEGRWFSCFVWAATRWGAHRSPESSACSQLQQATRASCFLAPTPDSICKLCPIFITYTGYLFYYLYVLSLT